MRKREKIYIIAAFVLLWLGAAKNAWALQSHPPPEGFYVHQMSHILFMGALAYLYWHTRRSTAIASRGWKYFQIFCILFFLWNLMAFTGHEIARHLVTADILNAHNLKERINPPITVLKAVYYVTRMDYFLNVPALLALVVSLRIFYRETRKEGER